MLEDEPQRNAADGPGPPTLAMLAATSSAGAGSCWEAESVAGCLPSSPAMLYREHIVVDEQKRTDVRRGGPALWRQTV